MTDELSRQNLSMYIYPWLLENKSDDQKFSNYVYKLPGLLSSAGQAPVVESHLLFGGQSQVKLHPLP